MKKVLVLVIALSVVASFSLAPVFAASWDKEIDAAILNEDFEAYDASDDLFSTEVNSENIPEGFIGAVYGGMDDRQQGGMIVAGKVGNSNSFRMFREGFSGTSTGNIRFSGLSTDYGDAEEIAVQFAFRFEKMGTHGFTMILGTSTTDPASWGEGSSNVFAVRNNPDDGAGSPAILARDGEAAAETLKVIKSGLEANKDYILTAVFKLGTNQYTVVLNGEVVGTYTYHETINEIPALRIDEHGYSDITDGSESRIAAQDVIFFDDIKIGTVRASNNGDNNNPSSPNQEPNNPTGDSSNLIFAVITLLLGASAFIALRKKAY